MTCRTAVCMKLDCVLGGNAMVTFQTRSFHRPITCIASTLVYYGTNLERDITSCYVVFNGWILTLEHSHLLDCSLNLCSELTDLSDEILNTCIPPLLPRITVHSAVYRQFYTRCYFWLQIYQEATPAHYQKWKATEVNRNNLFNNLRNTINHW